MSALLAAGCALCKRPVGVGGADDPVRAPRDHEQHRLLGAQDQAGLGVDPVARHHDVHALRGPHVEAAAAAGQRLDVVGPDAGAVDDDRGLDVDLWSVSTSRTRAPTMRSPAWCSSTDLGGVEHGRAVGRGGAGHRQGVAGVVGLGVVVHQRAGQRAALQRRHLAQRAAAGEVPVMRHRRLRPLIKSYSVMPAAT